MELTTSHAATLLHIVFVKEEEPRATSGQLLHSLSGCPVDGAATGQWNLNVGDLGISHWAICRFGFSRDDQPEVAGRANHWVAICHPLHGDRTVGAGISGAGGGDGDD